MLQYKHAFVASLCCQYMRIIPLYCFWSHILKIRLNRSDTLKSQHQDVRENFPTVSFPYCHRHRGQACDWGDVTLWINGSDFFSLQSSHQSTDLYTGRHWDNMIDDYSLKAKQVSNRTYSTLSRHIMEDLFFIQPNNCNIFLILCQYLRFCWLVNVILITNLFTNLPAVVLF